MYKRIQLIDFCGTLTISGDRLMLSDMNGRLIVSDPPACFAPREPEVPQKLPRDVGYMDINKAKYHLTYSVVAGDDIYWNVYCEDPEADPDTDARRIYQMRWTPRAKEASGVMLRLNQEWRKKHDKK